MALTEIHVNILQATFGRPISLFRGRFLKKYLLPTSNLSTEKTMVSMLIREILGLRILPETAPLYKYIYRLNCQNDGYKDRHSVKYLQDHW